MVRTCNVCKASLGASVYQSPDNASITTMNKVIPGKTEVYFCDSCGHLQTTELSNLDEYYAAEYEINLESDDADQLYKVMNGKPVYRADHQVHVLLQKLSLTTGMRVLDYGCAKAATLRKVLAARPGIVPLAFDVTDKYVSFWKQFVADGNWATCQPRAEWNGTIDIVLSSYALEHIKDLQNLLQRVNALLRSGGTFYAIVPNPYANLADFVVADHINHFSDPSLRTMLKRAGLETLEVDAESHDSAFIVTARKLSHVTYSLPDPTIIDALRQRAVDIARFWADVVQRIRTFESALSINARRAIYGAGFYGNFIIASLRNPDKIECFIDQNVHLRGRMIHGKPVVEPSGLGEEIDVVYVGLNPQHARNIIDGIAAWRCSRRNYFFL